MKRRAEGQAETRRRIVEAAFELHGTIGPARTTFSKIAEQAGVQRQTLYAHFPDERSLFMACSAHHLDRDCPPAPDLWADIPDRQRKLETALSEIYGWYARSGAVIGAVLRDAETDVVLREITELRFGPIIEGWAASLSDGASDPGAAAFLSLAMSFHTWRTLVQEGGLEPAAAAAVMTRAVCAAAPIVH